jgi:hypothetical protein
MADHVLGRRVLRDAAVVAHKQTTEQHKLVMRYPDIAARLCDPPLRYASPNQWHGFIPPAYDRERVDGTTPLNTSPYRAALMAILEAAAERADAERQGRAA